MMSNPIQYSSKVLKLALAFAALGACSVAIWGQGAPAITVGNVQITGLPDDWTHHHVVFSDPGSADDAIQNGAYERWFGVVNDPRYVMQQIKRGLPAQGSAAVDAAWIEGARRAGRDPGVRGIERRKVNQPSISKDWSMVLGSAAPGVGAGMYPAKFAFNAAGTGSSSPLNCANVATPDYVVYNTGAMGSASQASVVAYDNLYSSCSLQKPSVYWAFNTSGKVVTSVVLSQNGLQLAYVQTPGSGNAQLVVLTWSKSPAGRTVTGSVSGTAITLTAGTLTSMDVGAVLSGGSIPAGDTIATVTSGTAGTLTTAGTTASTTLTISADAGGPGTALANNVSYPSCTAPCAAILSFSGTTRSDTISSPYYDYSSDSLYVGDASGGLHKFHPVFNGAPAEVGSPWSSPSTTALTSPVYDNADGLVFVGDASGYLYSVNSSGTVTKSLQVAVSPGIIDGPLVDITQGYVYAMVSNDTSSTSSTNACAGGTKPCNAVIQLPVNFGTATTFNEDVTGIGTTNTLYNGSFDNQYWAAGTGTGNLYAVGATGTNAPKLSEIKISANVFQTGGACQAGYTKPPNSNVLVCAVNVDNPIASAAAQGSPLTEIYVDSTHDYIFAGVTANGNQTATCASATGCIYSWNATATLGTGVVAGAGSAELGGASGIIIDNIVTTGGGAEIYFSTLGATGTCATSGSLTSGSCAIQASQAAP